MTYNTSKIKGLRSRAWYGHYPIQRSLENLKSSKSLIHKGFIAQLNRQKPK
jgi:hypothetical protein